MPTFLIRTTKDEKIVYDSILFGFNVDRLNYYTGYYDKTLKGFYHNLYKVMWIKMLEASEIYGYTKNIAGMQTFGWKKDMHVDKENVYSIKFLHNAS